MSHVTDSRTENKVKIGEAQVVHAHPPVDVAHPPEAHHEHGGHEQEAHEDPQEVGDVLAGASGLSLIPRKMSGSEMSRIDWLIVTIKIPRVVFERAIHL